MQFVEQQFFPSSDRPELVVDVTLPQNASIAETRAQMDRLEAALVGDEDIDHWSSYVGQGAIRFVLAFDVLVPSPNIGQIIIVNRDLEARDRVEGAAAGASPAKQFVGTDIQVSFLPLGPPAGRPVQYRVGGPDIATVREIALGLATTIGDHPLPDRPHLRLDGAGARRQGRGAAGQGPPARRDLRGHRRRAQRHRRRRQHHPGARLDLPRRRARRGRRPAERQSVDTLLNLQLPGQSGQSVPLAAIATFSYEIEQPVVWRRSRIPTITLRAGIVDATQPATIVQQLAPEVAAYTATLPVGYTVSVAGPVEESAKAQGPIAAVVPLMLFVIATILMLQLRSFQRLFLVVAVAPLGLIGVVAALLPSGAPLGFVAILGVLALIGILIRNSVILIMQIEALRDGGTARLGRRLRRDPAPHAADPADRRRGKPRADPDRPRGLLGPDGLRDDGRHHRRHRPDAPLSARPLRRLVPHQGT